MPKLTVYIAETSTAGFPQLLAAVDTMKPLVAEAASTPGSELSDDDVDLEIKVFDPALCSFSQDVAVEIETFGYPERVAKLTEDVVRTLKSKMATIFEDVGVELDRSKPLLWLKYVNPRGHHV